MSEQKSDSSISSSGSSVDVKIVQRTTERLPAVEINIPPKEEEDEGSDESETRPKVVIHITVKSGGPTGIPTAEVRVIRSNQRVKVHSELRVEQDTIDIDKGSDTYTTLWRSDGKPLQFHIEIREAKPDPPSLDTYQWEGPGLPLKKIEKPKEFKRDEAASSLSSQGSEFREKHSQTH
jgi:hypothetical protein